MANFLRMAIKKHDDYMSSDNQVPSTPAIEVLKRHEGLKYKPYGDTKGYQTIGYGHLILPGESFTEITKEEAEQFFIKDYATAVKEVNKFPKDILNKLSRDQKDVLINMSYNMGSDKFNEAKWPDTFTAFREGAKTGNWEEAGAEMLRSNWRKDVKGRAYELSNILRGKENFETTKHIDLIDGKYEGKWKIE